MRNHIVIERWNKILLITCVMALSVDPLFFYIPVIDGNRKCLHLDRPLQITSCVVRTFLDLFYIILHVMLQFQTGFIAPSSRVFGPGELILDPQAISKAYLSSKFIVDILSIIPLPQVFFLAIIPVTNSSVPFIAKEFLKYIVLLQYVPRIVRIYPLFREVTKTSGILTETLWAGAAYNLLLYMLASHVVGACWYLLSVESEIRCWSQELKNAYLSATTYLSCGHQNSTVISLLNNSCPFIDPDDIDDPGVFNFGIFIDALRSHVVESTTNFPQKIFYCFLWGLRNLSSAGQNLNTSTFIEEILFTIFIVIFGLVLFALLIGNMQKYLQSMQTIALRAEIIEQEKKRSEIVDQEGIKRAEEMRIKRRDAEQWMSRYALPERLKERIRQHVGVEKETLIDEMPKDLRKDIKRHLCLDLLRRVPLFAELDRHWLNALCDKLNPVHYIERSRILLEGDPVEEMFFILRGALYSTTTNLNSGSYAAQSGLVTILNAGDFFGYELIGWAIDPNSSNHPISTTTVESVSEVEVFSLTADDLKVIVLQFRRSHIPRVRHAYRFYSTQWRTWAACFIQGTWRRQRRRKIEKSLREEEALVNEHGSAPSMVATIYALRFANNGGRNHECPLTLLPLKPYEPDFTA